MSKQNQDKSKLKSYSEEGMTVMHGESVIKVRCAAIPASVCVYAV